MSTPLISSTASLNSPFTLATANDAYDASIYSPENLERLVRLVQWRDRVSQYQFGLLPATPHIQCTPASTVDQLASGSISGQLAHVHLAPGPYPAHTISDSASVQITSISAPIQPAPGPAPDQPIPEGTTVQSVQGDALIQLTNAPGEYLSAVLRGPFLKALYEGFIGSSSVSYPTLPSNIDSTLNHGVWTHKLRPAVADRLWNTAVAVATVIKASGNGHSPFHPGSPALSTPIPDYVYESIGSEPLFEVDHVLAASSNPLSQPCSSVVMLLHETNIVVKFIKSHLAWLGTAMQNAMTQGHHSLWNFGAYFGISFGQFMELVTGIHEVHTVPFTVAPPADLNDITDAELGMSRLFARVSAADLSSKPTISKKPRKRTHRRRRHAHKKTNRSVKTVRNAKHWKTTGEV